MPTTIPRLAIQPTPELPKPTSQLLQDIATSGKKCLDAEATSTDLTGKLTWRDELSNKYLVALTQLSEAH